MNTTESLLRLTQPQGNLSPYIHLLTVFTFVLPLIPPTHTHLSHCRFQHATENRKLLEVSSFASEVFNIYINEKAVKVKQHE